VSAQRVGGRLVRPFTLDPDEPVLRFSGAFHWLGLRGWHFGELYMTPGRLIWTPAWISITRRREFPRADVRGATSGTRNAFLSFPMRQVLRVTTAEGDKLFGGLGQDPQQAIDEWSEAINQWVGQ
jgi:hypothetical protein